MFQLFSSLLLFCTLSLLEVQKCHAVMKLSLQDNVYMSALVSFDRNGSLNYEAISKLAQYYYDNGFKVIYVGGYYGAGPLLSLCERKRLVEVWVNSTNCLGMDLVVECGVLPFLDTLELARHCARLNVSAITVFPELWYQATTVEEAVEDLQRICDATGNKLPLLYHELVVVDQNIKTDEVFVGAMDRCVSCFVGALTNINSFLDIKASVPTIAGYLLVAYGISAIAASLKIGMNATESINLFPDLTWKIKDAVNRCQLTKAADIQQEYSRRMYAITNLNDGGRSDQTSKPYFEQTKAAFELITGIEVGFRYPFERPNSTVTAKIRSNLQKFGVCLYSDVNN